MRTLALSKEAKGQWVGPRPADFYNQKSCAQQYNKLQEEHGGAGTPRRKRGADHSAAGQMATESPEVRILRVMHQLYVEDIIRRLTEGEREMAQYQKDVDEIDKYADKPDDYWDETLQEIEDREEAEAQRDEEEKKLQEQRLQERAEKKKELDAKLKASTGIVSKELKGAVASVGGSAQGTKAGEEGPDDLKAASTEDVEASGPNVEETAKEGASAADHIVKEETLEEESTPAKVSVKKEDEEDLEVDVEKESKEEDQKLGGLKQSQQKGTEADVEAKEVPVAPRRSGRAIPTRPTRGSLAAAKKEEGQRQEEDTEGAEDKKTLPPPLNLPPPKRNKKVSERSNEDESAEESPAPTRSRRSANKREDEGDVGTPIENRRLNRLRDLEGAKVDGRGRRGSGATSRSSSPTGSEGRGGGMDSESEPPVRSTRSRKRSGLPSVSSSDASKADATAEESAPNSPASSVGDGASNSAGAAASAAACASGGGAGAGGGGSGSGTVDLAFKKIALTLLNNLSTTKHSNVFEPQSQSAAEAQCKCNRLDIFRIFFVIFL